MGLSKQWGERVLFSAGVETDFAGVEVGSVHVRALAPLPLLRVHLGRGVHLDAYCRWRPIQPQKQHHGLGLTWVTPRPR